MTPSPTAAVLVRDAMTIGVPVCRDTETCAAAAARLTESCPVVVALDDDGMACGWATLAQLMSHPSATVAEVMDEDIPTAPPDIPATVALQLMQERGVEYLFLMHSWPGEPRPSAMVWRGEIERRTIIP